MTGECLGFLLFGGRYPRIKIFQVLVVKKYRNHGVAKSLVNKLIQYGEKNNYLSVSARVASALSSNRFWEKLGFSLLRQVPGGKKAKRKINVRLRELDTPSLLTLARHGPPIPVTTVERIQFLEGPILTSQTYVLDLNIFFDVVRDRLHRKAASFLIRAGLNNQIRVCVTPEFAAELERHIKAGNADPILEFARELPSLPIVEESEIGKYIVELATTIFPEDSLSGKKQEQIRSDLLHLAYCIHHRTTGFITRERAILAATEQLKEIYAIEVLSPLDLLEAPNEFEDHPRIAVRACLGELKIAISDASEKEREGIEKFLVKFGLSPKMLPGILNSGTEGAPRRRVSISSDERIIGIAAWDCPTRLNRHSQLFFYLDETSPHCERIIDHVFETVLRQAEMQKYGMIHLWHSPEQVLTRDTALRRGWVGSSSLPGSKTQASLAKFTFRGVITPELWPDFRLWFEEMTGVNIGPTMPCLDEFENTGLMIKDRKGDIVARLGLFEFETLISPGLIACSGRNGVILPVRAHFARDLFGSIGNQMSLYPLEESVLYAEKAYFRAARRVDLFKKGRPVVFYLSQTGGGTMEVVGSARITHSALLQVEKVDTSLRRQGVLGLEQLANIAGDSGMLHAFTFDNFNNFQNRIPFRYLRERDLVSKANLVTAEFLDPRKLHEIWRVGFGLGSVNA